ncbi:TonB family protein [Ascidiimonas sp. W6]|uniref:energy transducer TonB n=1 Tax=Ascidiimonas meishanensis TaxID=3128903 RepID=UPI0030ED837B
MKPKKNPKLDLSRNSGLYFVIGLNIMLLITWRALELKTYDSTDEFISTISVIEDIKEDIPITQTINTPPPPPPMAAPEVIKIVEDIEEIEETIIESTETNQDEVISTAIVNMDEVEVGEEEEEISVPFSVIEIVPIFPGCEGGDNKQLRDCFQRKMQQHVKENFRYPDIALELGITGRVFVMFEINSKGHVTNIRTRGPDRTLESEALRIINALPVMTPGRQRGKSVKVPYSIPINFVLKQS